MPLAQAAGATDETAGDDLSSRLTAGGLPHRRQEVRLIPAPSPPPGVIVLDARRPSGDMPAFLDTSLAIGRILVTHRHPFEEDLRVPFARVPVSRLTTTTWRFLDEAWRVNLTIRVRRMLGVPFLVRESIVNIISDTSSLRPQMRPGSVRSLTRIAVQVGVSREHLTRTVKPLLDVQTIADEAMVVQAFWIMAAYGYSWDRIAWILGYHTLSGLHRLMQRVIGVGLRDAENQDPVSAALAWETRVMGELAAAMDLTEREA